VAGGIIDDGLDGSRDRSRIARVAGDARPVILDDLAHRREVARDHR